MATSTASLTSSTLFNITGLTAVVTGGGSGIGLTFARALATNGAKAVYIIGRRKEYLDKAASSHPNIIIPLVGDVTSKDSLSAAAAHVKEKSGHVDVLIANSGILGPMVRNMGLPADREPTVEEFAKAMWDGSSMEDFTQTYHVNVTGAFYTVLAFLPLLDAGNQRRSKVQGVVEAGMQKSQVVITSSIAGWTRVPNAGFAYSTSKAGTTHLVKTLCTSFSKFGVRVNGIAPGMFPSEMNPSGTDKKKEGDVPRETIPMARFGTEEEMAGAVLFLSSPAGGYMNGEVLLIDGGRLSQIPAVY